jgi:hypothetical protein
MEIDLLLEEMLKEKSHSSNLLRGVIAGEQKAILRHIPQLNFITQGFSSRRDVD